MSKKRLLSIVISAVILLSFACTAMAAEKSERYVGDSTVNGSIYQTYYQVDAQTRTGVKKISVSGVLYGVIIEVESSSHYLGSFSEKNDSSTNWIEKIMEGVGIH